MNILCFRNPGEIDPFAFKTLGVSAKESENAIGFFGTGLKYAIAIVLREGGEISICSGLDRYDFSLRHLTLRGKEFALVTCNGEDLGFTTELGKKWEMWMAYRELFSNCLDERGSVETVEDIDAREGETRIFVSSAPMMAVHQHKEQVFLEGAPLFIGENAEIFEGPTKTLFYKGIKVATLRQASRFTYNILDSIDLTEDRTVKYEFQADGAIARTLAQMRDEEMIRKLFSSEDSAYERSFGFASNLPFSDEFLAVARDCYRSDPKKVHSSLHGVINKIQPGSIFSDLTLSPVEDKKLADAVRFCSAIGFDTSGYRLTVVETLGPSVLAMARRDEQQIVVSRRVFHQGLKQLCSTLIEEVIHLREGLNDCSREMQTFLFDYIASMGEQITGDSL